MEIQQDLRRSCGRASDNIVDPETHAAPRNEMKKGYVLAWVQGVWVIQRLLGIQNLCKSATQSLRDFTIQILAKTQTTKLYSVRPTACVSCGG
jgi:hypothetical protein